MEHHTYAKSGSKKWSVEEKRQLVTKRIEAEDLFSKYSSKQTEPWKKFKDMAKIGDYSERALRKQWLNMVQRYRIQKSNMQVTPLNKQCIDVLNEEWEFFGEIHAYMNQKTTDLHSYALKEPNVQEQPHPDTHSHSQSPNHLAIRGVVNDHNFGPLTGAKPFQKRYQMGATPVDRPTPQDQQDDQLPQGSCNEQRYSHFSVTTGDDSTLDLFTDSDSQESSQPSDPVAVEVSDLSEVESLLASPLPAKSASDICEPNTVEQLPTSYETASGSMPLDEQPPATKSASWSGSASAGKKPATAQRKRKVLSEKEKYYRHRRRYEHRMERRLGGLCKVAGQVLEKLMPGVNVTPLLTDIYNSVDDYNCDSSCDDDDDGDDESNDDAVPQQ
ncbi:PREDICTED: uncharacterized protein LOC108619976 [Drosophila arizonae]|uniref:Uncharacterized protein LOC108619976 n=1 Tax=Drosophila arizonae TaxID=7263 RepID=A0ABM1PYM3_DROAR|nr:PREDICTED: uncharacterized protein LOC108619976 [Drosophila arizonae]